MNRFFIPKDQVKGDTLSICGSDVNHIKNVLRKQISDEIICFDGSGFEYLSKIENISKDRITLKIISRNHSEIEPKIQINLCQCLPKQGKMDDIVKKSVELGVHEITPVISERSIPKKGNIERWQKIAKEAAQQSGRLIVPEVFPPHYFDEILHIAEKAKLKLIAYEGEKTKHLKDVLKTTNPSSVAVFVGPEGGFSAEEVKTAIDHGFECVSLGKRILRTETAGLAVISMILYEYE